MDGADITMQCQVVTGEQMIGTVDLRYTDPSMGVMTGYMIPNSNYTEEIRKAAQAFTALQLNDISWDEYGPILKAMGWRIQLMDARIVPNLWIALSDWSYIHEDETRIEVTICGTNPDQLRDWLAGKIDLPEHLE